MLKQSHTPDPSVAGRQHASTDRVVRNSFSAHAQNQAPKGSYPGFSGYGNTGSGVSPARQAQIASWLKSTIAARKAELKMAGDQSGLGAQTGNFLSAIPGAIADTFVDNAKAGGKFVVQAFHDARYGTPQSQALEEAERQAILQRLTPAHRKLYAHASLGFLRRYYAHFEIKKYGLVHYLLHGTPLTPQVANAATAVGNQGVRDVLGLAPGGSIAAEGLINGPTGAKNELFSEYQQNPGLATLNILPLVGGTAEVIGDFSRGGRAARTAEDVINDALTSESGRVTGAKEGAKADHGYRAIPQGRGPNGKPRFAMLNESTHRYLADGKGNRRYFSSPKEGDAAAAKATARTQPGTARQGGIIPSKETNPHGTKASGRETTQNQADPRNVQGRSHTQELPVHTNPRTAQVHGGGDAKNIRSGATGRIRGSIQSGGRNPLPKLQEGVVDSKIHPGHNSPVVVVSPEAMDWLKSDITDDPFAFVHGFSVYPEDAQGMARRSMAKSWEYLLNGSSAHSDGFRKLALTLDQAGTAAGDRGVVVINSAADDPYGTIEHELAHAGQIKYGILGSPDESLFPRMTANPDFKTMGNYLVSQHPNYTSQLTSEVPAALLHSWEKAGLTKEQAQALLADYHIDLENNVHPDATQDIFGHVEGDFGLPAINKLRETTPPTSDAPGTPGAFSSPTPPSPRKPPQAKPPDSGPTKQASLPLGVVPAMMNRTPGLEGLYWLTAGGRQALLNRFYGRNASIG